MSDVERRYRAWLDLVAELLTTPGPGGFPSSSVESALVDTFGCHMTCNWRDADGTAGFDLVGDWGPEGFENAIVSEWETHGGLDNHPILQWFAVTGDTRAMTLGRVPESVASAESRGLVRELLTEYDAEQQLSIPVCLDGPEHRAYVLSRADEDFSDEDLELARRIQPLLEVLDRQSRIVEQRRVAAADGLTGRELATLALLTDGLTAVAIAHRLEVSPRTVHKHLEHLYRKLGVRDRLQAVLVARDTGLLGDEAVQPSL